MGDTATLSMQQPPIIARNDSRRVGSAKCWQGFSMSLLEGVDRKSKVRILEACRLDELTVCVDHDVPRMRVAVEK